MAYFFFFNDTATTEIYTLSLHDALPICRVMWRPPSVSWIIEVTLAGLYSIGSSARRVSGVVVSFRIPCTRCRTRDRKSTRLNSSHANISYAVFCLKKKKTSHPALLLFHH